MDSHELLRLSDALAELARLIPSTQEFLLSTHAYRYRHFVRSSPRGLHCRYARASLKLYGVDQEHLVLRPFLQEHAPQLLELL